MINPTVCMPTMCNNSLRMKLSVILQTESSFDLTEEVAVARCRSRPYSYSFTNKPVLDLERWQYSEKNLSYHHFRLLPGCCPPLCMFNVQWCRPLSVDVVYIRLALCPNFGVPTMFLFWQSQSYKYFRFCRQLTSTVENVSLIVAFGQILLSECRANNADLEWRWWYHWNLLNYYNFRFRPRWWIFDRQWCRTLLFEVTYTRIAL